ncbi:MAG: hypothetical protein AAF404_06450 [Pseudomonadota bacterium]
MINVALFGLGEAGSLIGSQMAAMAADKKIDLHVCGFDPADVATPVGIDRHTSPEQAEDNADVV